MFDYREDKLINVNDSKPPFDKGALFSDTTANYIEPDAPRPYDLVKIRFRTAANNVDTVCLISNGHSVPMTKESSDALFDYYVYEEQLEGVVFKYSFLITRADYHVYYDACGVINRYRDTYPFVIKPGFSTPDWAKGAVMYQIYVERFCNGDPKNDVVSNEYYYNGGTVTKVDDWNKPPAPDGTREFYGGDLLGIIEKLDYLKDLGVDVIYLNPVFVSPSNHKYDTQDYDFIDPHFGKIVSDGGEVLAYGDTVNKNASRYIKRVTHNKNLEASNLLFLKLVMLLHERDMRIIIDGVFNHCGSFHKWMDKELIYETAKSDDMVSGAYVTKYSPYRSYFSFIKEDGWPYNGEYEGWWGYDTLPKLNYDKSELLRNTVLDIGAKWMAFPYNVDGWRLDVAADLGKSAEVNHKFWKDFRKAVKRANPDALILAEHYGDVSEWLKGDEWDSVMNYDAFMEPVTWYLTGMEKHSDDFRPDLLANADAFWHAMRHCGSKFCAQSISVAMNQLSNHDHSRFLTRTNRRVGRIGNLGFRAADEGINKAVFCLGVLIQMTWIGAPTLYYGDEAGLCGFTDPDNRRTYPWGHEDTGIMDFYKAAIRLHKGREEIICGSLKPLLGQDGQIAYGRFTKNAATLVVINPTPYNKSCALRVCEIGVSDNTTPIKLLFTDRSGGHTYTKDEAEDGSFMVKNGYIEITLPPESGIALGFNLKAEA